MGDDIPKVMPLPWRKLHPMTSLRCPEVQPYCSNKSGCIISGKFYLCCKVVVVVGCGVGLMFVAYIVLHNLEIENLM